MPDEKVLQVAILIWGCVFCAIAALCIFLSSNYDREKRRYLILMESFASLLLLMDAMAHIFSGYPGVPGNVMVRISSFLVFLLSDVVLLCFHIYVCVYLFSKRERRTLKRVKAGYVIAAAGVAFVVISQFTHWYYYIDGDNCYHRAPLYIMSILFRQQACSLILRFCSSTKRESAGSSCSLCCHALYFRQWRQLCRYSGMECR